MLGLILLVVSIQIARYIKNIKCYCAYLKYLLIFQTNNAIWPYPCPRPYFKTCWIYRTVMFNTISAAASQLRILWACLRWDELTAKTAHLASKREVTTETELVTTETLECRTSGQFNERTEYLIRKVVIPLDIPKQVRGKCE